MAMTRAVIILSPLLLGVCAAGAADVSSDGEQTKQRLRGLGPVNPTASDYGTLPGSAEAGQGLGRVNSTVSDYTALPNITAAKDQATASDYGTQPGSAEAGQGLGLVNSTVSDYTALPNITAAKDQGLLDAMAAGCSYQDGIVMRRWGGGRGFPKTVDGCMQEAAKRGSRTLAGGFNTDYMRSCMKGTQISTRCARCFVDPGLQIADQCGEQCWGRHGHYCEYECLKCKAPALERIKRCAQVPIPTTEPC